MERMNERRGLLIAFLYAIKEIFIPWGKNPKKYKIIPGLARSYKIFKFWELNMEIKLSIFKIEPK